MRETLYSFLLFFKMQVVEREREIGSLNNIGQNDTDFFCQHFSLEKCMSEKWSRFFFRYIKPESVMKRTGDTKHYC